MISPEQYTRIIQTLPVLQGATPPMRREFMQAARMASIPAGYDVFVEGDEVDAIALLISGVVRVYKISQTGREITLYRFGLGESCILTANAILSQKTFPAIATVEKQAEAVLIPAQIFRDWVNRYDLWRSFVFDLLSQRLVSMMAVVEEVAFQRMDRRVATYLLERSSREAPIRVTHQEIAADLGSSREVISRILENFASQGVIHSERGMIQIIDTRLLQEFSIR